MSDPFVNKSLRTLLEIENDSELIHYACPETGLPIWPFIRIPVIRTIMADWLYKSAPLRLLSQNINYIKFARNTAISAIHNIGCREVGKRNILIQSTGLGNFTQGGLIKDRLAGYFAESLPKQTLIYQDKPKEGFRQKYSFEAVLHRTPRKILYKVCSNLVVNSNHKRLARIVIDRAARNALEQLGYDFNLNRIENLTDSLAAQLAILPYESDGYANWIYRKGFKLLLKEDACYGGSGISLIHAARLNNIVVAEYQHGAISKGHEGYNVADILSSSELYKKVLPDYLLTYGNWWSNQTNMPVKKIAIGNPHLTDSLKKVGVKQIKSNKLLILGNGIETELYIDFASRIYRLIAGQGVVVEFRPHPFERERIKSSALPSGVCLDVNPDIYSSLRDSRIVISELSTGLFEAAGLVDKVLLWNTERSRFAFPELPFDSFSTEDELQSILCDDFSSRDDSRLIPANELWEPNWEQNYMRFVEGAISL